MSRMFDALSMQFKKQIAEGAGSVAFDGVKCYTPKATFYGACQQDGTPTPENPVPVLCNNAKWKSCGRNLFDKNNVSDRFIGSGTDNPPSTFNDYAGRLVFFLPCKPNTTYTASRIALTTNERFYLYSCADKPGVGTAYQSKSSFNSAATVGKKISTTLTTRSDAKYLACWAYWDSETEALDTLQIEEGSIATEYEPYFDGGTVDLSLLPDGGLYGIGDAEDELDAVSGDGVRRIGKVDLGTLYWNRYSDVGEHAFFQANVLDRAYGGKTNFISSGLTVIRHTSTRNGYTRAEFAGEAVDNAVGALYANSGFVVRCDAYTSATDFAEAMSGVMLYYELATPVPFHATPQPLIQANGLNALTQISGDIDNTDVAVEYVKHS